MWTVYGLLKHCNFNCNDVIHIRNMIRADVLPLFVFFFYNFRRALFTMRLTSCPVCLLAPFHLNVTYIKYLRLCWSLKLSARSGCNYYEWVKCFVSLPKRMTEWHANLISPPPQLWVFFLATDLLHKSRPPRSMLAMVSLLISFAFINFRVTVWVRTVSTLPPHQQPST